MASRYCSVEGLVSAVERFAGCSIVGLAQGISALALVALAVWQRSLVWTFRQQYVALEETLREMGRKSSSVDTLEPEATTGDLMGARVHPILGVAREASRDIWATLHD